MKKAGFLLIFSLLTVFITASHLLALTRGISVVSKEGKDLFLYKNYYALVVGISDYEKWPGLPYAVSDAIEVAERLKKMGFKVKLVLDPTSRELKTALSEMTYGMGGEKNGAILFYYAGHGETETMADGTRMGYIVPKDCPILEKDPIGFTTHAVSMREIESVSLRIRAKHVLMLFDSCFSGALFALVRAVPDDITEKSARPVRQYITAGREDEQVPDKSMFKRCFLIGLDGNADMTGDGYITGSEMGMYLADNVVNYTRRRQHPQYGKINNPDLDQGDFIFVPHKTIEKRKKGKRHKEENAGLARDIEKLKADREQTQKLLSEMKSLLQGKVQTEEQKKERLAEKKALEIEISRLAKERDTVQKLGDTRTKEYEAMLSASKESMMKEAEKRKALEAELEQLRMEKEEAAQRNQALQAMQEKMKKEAEKRKTLEAKLEKQKREREKTTAQKLALADIQNTRPKTAVTGPAPKIEANQPPVKKQSPAEMPAKTPGPEPGKVQDMAKLHVPKVKPEKNLSTLIVTSNIKSAKVYIDKKEISFWASPEEAWIFRGAVPFKAYDVAPGRHEIRVHEDDYLEEVKIVNISPGETLELDVTLFRSLSETGDEDHGGGGGGGGGGGM